MATALKGEKPQQIQVFVRARPVSKYERDNKSVNNIEIVGNKEICIKQPHGKKYYFDKVFGPYSKQIDVYITVVHPLISEVLAGYNCTVFAYGQTGAGKTYTMAGASALQNSGSWLDDETVGIIPRALSHLFDELRLLQQESTVRVSYLELYNEELYDLLADNDDAGRIRIFEDQHQKGSVIIHGIEEQTVLNTQEVYKILEKGQEKRRTAATLMNAQSSRSHTVFTITVHSRETTVEGEILVKTGKLHLVDLAGSENIGKSGAIDKRAREAGNINQSLLTLGRVIKALVERTLHIPYRESKLTRILQDSLGGRTKTSIIANISLASSNIEETLSTLDYANRARNITNRPEVNLRTSQKGLMLQYMDEITRLRKDLTAARTGTGIYLAQENYEKLVTDNEIKKGELAEKIVLVRDIQDRLKNVEEEKARVEMSWNALQRSFDESKKHLNHVTNELAKTVKEKEEQQFLAVTYEDKCLKLHEEGNELLKIAKSSLNNEDVLHNKIEFIRKMSNANTNSVRSVIKTVDNLERSLFQSLLDHTKYSTKINGKLTELSTCSREYISERQSQANTYKNMLVEQLNSSSTTLLNDMNETQRNNIQTFISDVYNSCASTETAQTSYHNLFPNELFNSLKCELNKNQEDFEDFCGDVHRQLDDIKQTLSPLKSTTVNIENMVSEISAEINNIKADVINRVTCTDARLQGVNESQNEMSQLLGQVMSLATKIQNESKSNEEYLLNQQKQNHQFMNTFNNMESKLNTEVPLIVSTINNNIQKLFDHEADVVNTIELKKQQVASDNTTNQDLLRKIQIETNTREECIISETQKCLAAVDKLSNDILNKQKEDETICKQALQLHLNILEETINKNSNNADQAYIKCIDNLNIMEHEISQLQESTNTTTTLLVQNFTESQRHLNQCVSDSLVEMDKSGNTPVRTHLPSSIKLLQPTPRQKILMRYNENTEDTTQDSNNEVSGTSSTHVAIILETPPLNGSTETNNGNEHKSSG